MFPAPIQEASAPKRYAYCVAIVIAVLFWLLPLLAVLLTSVRSIEDLNAGNYWGLPREWKFSNYSEVFQSTPMLRYMLNTVIITVPAVAGAIALATLAGYALAKFRFRGN